MQDDFHLYIPDHLLLTLNFQRPWRRRRPLNFIARFHEPFENERIAPNTNLQTSKGSSLFMQALKAVQRELITICSIASFHTGVNTSILCFKPYKLVAASLIYFWSQNQINRLKPSCTHWGKQWSQKSWRVAPGKLLGVFFVPLLAFFFFL